MHVCVYFRALNEVNFQSIENSFASPRSCTPITGAPTDFGIRLEKHEMAMLSPE